jgi:hypothetical protein
VTHHLSSLLALARVRSPSLPCLTCCRVTCSSRTGTSRGRRMGQSLLICSSRGSVKLSRNSRAGLRSPARPPPPSAHQLRPVSPRSRMGSRHMEVDMELHNNSRPNKLRTGRNRRSRSRPTSWAPPRPTPCTPSRTRPPRQGSITNRRCSLPARQPLPGRPRSASTGPRPVRARLPLR